MRAKTVIHLPIGKPLRTAEDIKTVLDRMDRLPQNGTLMFKRLTDHGSVKTCFIPRATVVRLEEA